MIFPGFVQFPYFIRIYAFTEEKTSAMCTGTAQNSGNVGNKGLGSDSVEKNAIKTAGGENFSYRSLTICMFRGDEGQTK